MSRTFVTTNSPAALFKCLGLKDKSLIKTTSDGECVFIKANIIDEVYSSEEKKKFLNKVVMVPSAGLDFSKYSKLEVRRIIVDVNPKLYNLGIPSFPRIIEPTEGEEVFLNLVVNSGVCIKDIKDLPYIFKLYIFE